LGYKKAAAKIKRPKAQLSKTIFIIFLVTTKSLNVIGNNANDLVSSNENESMFRKKGLKSHKTISELNNTIKVK